MINSRNSPFDNLQNEIAREKFSSLRRISENLSSCLKELETINGKIDEAMGKNLPRQDINRMIEAFNRMREDAEEWRYYFIVTREASGYFQGSLMPEAYRIPPQLELIKEK